MPVAAASIGVRLAPSTSPISGHMLMCEHSAGIFRSYAVIIMLRLIVYWQSSWASVKSIAEGKPSDSTLHHYASARVKTICSSSALFCCANARARARRFWADCRDAALVSRRTMLVVAVLASGFAQDSALCASSRTQGDNIWGLVIGWLDLLRVSSIRRCAGIMSRKAYKQGVRAPLLWPRVAGRRAFVPAGCGGYTLLFDIVPHPALLVAGAVSGRRCRFGGGGGFLRTSPMHSACANKIFRIARASLSWRSYSPLRRYRVASGIASGIAFSDA
jgi:hypothetical protein